jgi:hypothetical protein
MSPFYSDYTPISAVCGNAEASSELRARPYRGSRAIIRKATLRLRLSFLANYILTTLTTTTRTITTTTTTGRRGPVQMH